MAATNAEGDYLEVQSTGRSSHGHRWCPRPTRGQAGKEDEVASFLEGALPLAQQEDATTAWFATRLGPSTFGIFDVFPDESGRDAICPGRSPAR
jgi:hypothetical protein